MELFQDCDTTFEQYTAYNEGTEKIAYPLKHFF